MIQSYFNSGIHSVFDYCISFSIVPNFLLALAPPLNISQVVVIFMIFGLLSPFLSPRQFR